MKKVCNHPMCTKIAEQGSAYCESHVKAETKNTRSSTQMGYDYRWQKIRKVHLQKNPLCVECMRTQGIVTVATVVDHITPHKGNRQLFYDIGNHQSLCVSCHNRKSAKERGSWSGKL